MKKSILFFIICFGFITAQAQVKFGSKAGLNYSHIKDFGENKSRFGIYGGLIAEINATKRIFIRPEVLYSSKGKRYSSTGFNSSGAIRFNYASIPLLVGFMPSRNFSVMAGPELNFLINVNSVFDGSDHDMTQFYEKFDLAINVGAAYKLTGILSIEARYSHSLKDLIEVEFADNMGNILRRDKIGNHRVFQFGLVYYFRRGKTKEG